ncbi:MAG TPA: TetR/AcrR family transcriptional regulator [Bdellovibrionota bacterium]|nr:TetR/AcrR family transcriptional regulator [Bdellovibrionota bacterium]
MSLREDTATRILDVAEKLVQTGGFNGFSYADVAGEVRVRKASLHHHFATKSQLGTRLISRYQERFMGVLAAIEQGGSSPAEQLERYVAIYAGVLKKNRMCLCGILAAEYATLPKPMRDGVTRFFAANEGWLASLLERGRKSGDLVFAGSPLETSRFVVASLEGAMLVARAQRDFSRFQSAASHLQSMLVARRH